MFLPNELLIQIFMFLTRADCKRTRLVAKKWSLIAADLVFDCVYIRPHDENLNAFTAIADHPILHSRVIAIHFDARPFELGLTKDAYLQLLLRQLKLEIRDSPGFPLNIKFSNGLDEDCQQLLEHASKPLLLGQFELARKEKDLCHLPIVTKGYANYRKIADEQTRRLESATFWPKITQGLTKMQRIKHITFDVSWIHSRSVSNDISNPHLPASFILQPGYTVPGLQWIQLSHLLCASQNSQILPRKLSLELDVPEQTSNFICFSAERYPNVLGTIECLSLSLGPRFTPSCVRPILKLSKLMPSLRALSVNVTLTAEVSDTSYWAVQELLFRHFPWPTLLKLDLSCVTVEIEDLFLFLDERPRLQNINLDNVKILKAHCTATMEAAERFRRIHHSKHVNEQMVGGQVGVFGAICRDT